MEYLGHCLTIIQDIAIAVLFIFISVPSARSNRPSIAKNNQNGVISEREVPKKGIQLC